MRIYQNERRVYILEAIYVVATLVLALLLFRQQFVAKVYFAALVICALCALAIWVFGYHRDKHYLRSYATRIIVSCLLLAAIVSYMLGLILGYTYSSFSLDIGQIACGLLPVALVSAGTEMLRYLVFRAYYRKTLPVVIFTTITIIMNVLLVTNVGSFTNAETIFITICSCILPIMATEAICSYLCLTIGLQPALTYKLPVRLYLYVLPILPNLGTFIYAVTALVLPASIFVLTSNLISVNREKQKLIGKRVKLIAIIPAVIAMLVIVSLVSGIFKHQIIAVASDSMRPTLSRGDAVIFEKTVADEINEDDILVFKHEGIIITHRVKTIRDDNGSLEFTTQGDANEEVDGFTTSESQVLGRVVSINKYIGFPTVWLNEFLKAE